MTNTTKVVDSKASCADSAYAAAESWAAGLTTDLALVGRFAFEYAETIADFPALRFPDSPPPTPAEFAEDNAIDYSFVTEGHLSEEGSNAILS